MKLRSILYSCPRLRTIRSEHLHTYFVEYDEIHNFYDHPGIVKLIDNPGIKELEIYPDPE